MLSLIAMLLGIAILSSSVDSQCPMKCSVNILNKYPGNGYRASVTVVSPVWVRRRRRVVIRMKFDKLVKKVEHVHIVGGNLRRKGSNITRNEVRLLFRPQATIRKAKSKVKIEFILRAPANPPVLTEVRFWRKIACSNSGCPSNVTTAKPVITKLPTTKLSPTEPVKTTKRPEPATEEPEEKTTNAPATQPPIKTEKPEVTEAPEEKTTPASATEPPTKTEGPQVTEAPEEKSTPAPATEPPTTTERPPVTEAPEEKTTPVRATEPPIKTERPQVTEAPEQKTTPAPETEPPTRKPPTEAPEEKSTPAATEPSVIIGAV